MTVVTISRGSYSMGKAVAEEVASRLGFECLSRDVLLEASDAFNIPELKLEQAISDAPSILERITHGKQTYMAYIRSALTSRLRKDDVVYHGLAGHVLVQNVSHVLKVRIIADLEHRASIVIAREKLGPREAAAFVSRLDAERRKWSKVLYDADPADPALYDLMLKVPRFEVKEAAEIICRASTMQRFASTAESRQQMEDLALACQIKARIVEQFPTHLSVVSKYGNVLLYWDGGERNARKVKKAAEKFSSLEGVNNIEVHTVSTHPPEAV